MKFYADEINEYVQNGKIDQLIQIAESRHLLQFEQLRRLIAFSCTRTCGSHLTAAVLVTGPSSSGKTTFSRRLSEMMRQEGFSTTVISVDDYYLSREEIRLRQGTEDPDFEIIEAFDVDYFRKQMRAFLLGDAIALPAYDFKIGDRVESGRLLVPTPKDLLIIEGIHAMNPVMTEGLPFARTIGVYISPFDFYDVGELGEISSKEIRLMRRCLRDLVHRNSGIAETVRMWPSVRQGEELYIKPMKEYADFFFNSSFEYEICILKARIEEAIRKLTPEELREIEPFIPLKKLSAFASFAEAEIPEDSIFNEFYR